MKKVIYIYLILSLFSCQGYKVVLVNKVYIKDLSIKDTQSIISKLNGSANMEDFLKGISKYCYGNNSLHKTVVLCIKNNNVYIHSYYSSKYEKELHNPIILSKNNRLSKLDKKQLNYHLFFLHFVEGINKKSVSTQEIINFRDSAKHYEKIINNSEI